MWIKCSDRLPEKYEDVLAVDGTKIYMAYWVSYYTEGERKTWYSVGGLRLENVTHWMPLPKLP